MTTSKPTAVTRSRLTLIFLLAIFALPMVAAYVAFFSGAFNERTASSHGELLSPPALIDNFSFEHDGEQFDTESMKRHWWLVYVNEANTCDQDCDEVVTMMRQVHTALGKNQERLKRMLVSAEQGQLTEKFPALTALSVDFSDGLLKAKTNDPELSDTLLPKHIYVIDPRGFVILAYDPKQRTEPKEIYFKGIVKDLKKLMKFSRVG